MQHFILLALLSFWPAAIYVVKKNGYNPKLTFSKHAAKKRSTILIFGTAIVLESLFYSLFYFGWFVKEFDTSVALDVLMVLILLGHVSNGLVPETNGWKKKFHQWAGYLVAVLFVPCLFIFALMPYVASVARIFAGFGLLIQALCLGLSYKVSFIKQNYIFVQAFFIASLPITMLLTTYKLYR